MLLFYSDSLICMLQRIIKSMLENTRQKSNSPQLCFLCERTEDCFQTLVSHSLYGKYSSSQNFYYTKDIDAILHEDICQPCILFNQYNYLDEEEQYLKREYAHAEFDKKINMLSQYYKFHRDLPVWGEKPLYNIMTRYYDRMKDYDYKKIKRILKEEQNVSITTHKSFSSFQNSEQPTKKSRYTTMLRELNHTNNQSFILMDICDKIGKALRRVKGRTIFKGNFQCTDRKFEDFIKRENQRKEETNQTRKRPFGFKKIKFNPKLQTKNDQMQIALKEINFISNRSNKNVKIQRKSVQKTTANETISREEKSKTKREKINIAPSTERTSVQFQKRRASQSSKMIKTKNFATLVGENLKTIDEIYKPTERELMRKDSSRIFSKLKNRSNSHHALRTTSSRNRELQSRKDPEGVGRLIRVNSQRASQSTAKATVIDLGPTKKSKQKIQQTQRISRCSSLKRVNSAKKIDKQSRQQVTKKKVDNYLSQRKNSVIENMLSKKLELFKKKQPLF